MVNKFYSLLSILIVLLLISCNKDDTSVLPTTPITPVTSAPTSVTIQKVFEKRFGGSFHYQAWSGNTLIQTLDEAYLMLATVYDGKDDNLYLLKTDASGNVLWEKQFGGDFREMAGSVRQTTDGGYIVIGSLMKRPNQWTKTYYSYIIKLSANGVVEWEKSYGDGKNTLGWAIEETTDGGFITLNEYDDLKTLLIKINSKGDSLMSSTLSEVSISFSAGRDIIATNDGGCVFIGNKGGLSSIIKTDEELSIEWSKLVNTATYPNTIQAKSICTAPNESFIVLGEITDSNTSDYYLLKLDKQGNEIWNKSINYALGDDGKSIKATKEGGYVFIGQSSGQTNRHILIIKVDAEGNKEWEKAFSAGEYSQARAVIEKLDGSYAILTGDLNYSSHLMEMILIKLHTQK